MAERTGRTRYLRPPWKPGESGNPSGKPGRPKTKPITEAYQAVISDRLPEHLRKVKLGQHTLELPEGSTFADLIAIGQCASAIKGNTAAAEEIANRLEGKVAVELDVIQGVSLGERIRAARMRLERRSASDDDAKETAEEDGAGSYGTRP
jgi:hypothetical protein